MLVGPMSRRGKQLLVSRMLVGRCKIFLLFTVIQLVILKRHSQKEHSKGRAEKAVISFLFLVVNRIPRFSS